MLTKFATAALALVACASAQYQQYGQNPYQMRQGGKSAFSGAFGGQQAMKVPKIPAVSGQSVGAVGSQRIPTIPGLSQGRQAFHGRQQAFGPQTHQQKVKVTQVQGIAHVRRDTYRPRDIHASITIDPYWHTNGKSDEKIIASCEFDFLGSSSSKGTIELSQKDGDSTLMIGDIQGISSNIHALKVHEFGDVSGGCSSIGPVYNPYGAQRGHSHEVIHDKRVGDLEQVQGRFDKNAEYKNRDGYIDLSGPMSIVGRSIALYEREDDHDETEHAPRTDREGRKREGEGSVIACCVVGLAKGEKPKVMY